MDAAEIGDLDTVQRIIASKVVDLDAVDDDLYSALLTAAEAGNVDVVRELKEAGADIENCDSYRRTPLYAAAVAGHIDVVRYLDTGANVGDRNCYKHSIF